MISPAVLLLLGWMIVPLSMTIYFSFLNYNLLTPGLHEWIGFTNYEFFLTDPAFFAAMGNTLLLVGGVSTVVLPDRLDELRRQPPSLAELRAHLGVVEAEGGVLERREPVVIRADNAALCRAMQ